MSSLAVVIPDRDHATLLVDCLDALKRVISDGVDDDDASIEATAGVARRRGATVTVNEEPGGPYMARNIGWRATEADVVAFTDVRCRARPGWLDAMVEALETNPDAEVVDGDTYTQPGPSAAERFAHRRQDLLAAPTLAHDFLPYLPTCNLAIRRLTLESVGGFTEERSGGDVDLSWRVQLAGEGVMGFAPGADLDWVPRSSLRVLVRQYRKYGDAWPRTAARFLTHGFTPQVPKDMSRPSLVAAHLRVLIRRVRASPDDLTNHVVERLCWFAYWDAHHRSYHRELLAGVPLPHLAAR